EKLLVELRRLRQREPRSRRDPARHEIVAGPFRRRSTEKRRLELEKSLAIERVADHLVEPMPHREGPLQRRSAEIEVAILEAEVLAGELGVHELAPLERDRLDLERRRRRLVQDFPVRDDDLDLARRKLLVGLPLVALADSPLDGENPLVADVVGM